MGISIDLWNYPHKELKQRLVEWGATDEELLDKILLSCGAVNGDTYSILNNEHANGEYNPYYTVAALLDSAFPEAKAKQDSFDVFLVYRDHTTMQGKSYVDVYAVAERLGIELISEDGE